MFSAFLCISEEKVAEALGGPEEGRTLSFIWPMEGTLMLSLEWTGSLGNEKTTFSKRRVIIFKESSVKIEN